MTDSMENAVVPLQQEVQRKLGRCMLRLQQYERLLKALTGSMAVAGPPEELYAVRDRQVAEVRGRTLGVLVGAFTGSHMAVTSSGPQPEEDRMSGGSGPAGMPWASIGFKIAMSPERHAQTKAGLAELAELRNELVHHLIEKFSISGEDGCRAASAYLDDCYARIDAHCRTLGSWATAVNEGRARIAALAQSKSFGDALLHAMDRGGPVDLSGSRIVECLRDAEKTCMVEGWASLSAAVTFISRKSSDQFPSRYGCRTWRQVLQRSGQFEIRSTAGSAGMSGQTWYRSRQDGPAPALRGAE